MYITQVHKKESTAVLMSIIEKPISSVLISLLY